jgi:hypothetical protein
MALSHDQISSLVLEELSNGERRLLALVVAVRKSLSRTQVFRGDLASVVKLSVRKFIASGMVHEVDGLYTLRRQR